MKVAAPRSQGQIPVTNVFHRVIRNFVRMPVFIAEQQVPTY
jgi:hypothetical protein